MICSAFGRLSVAADRTPLLKVCRLRNIDTARCRLVRGSAADNVRMVGERVRTARLAAGLSQEALADKSGFHRTYVGSVERGERNLTLTSLLRLADALHTTASDLLKGAG